MTITDEDRKKLLGFINFKDTGQLMVSVLGEQDTLRKTYILNRGVYDAPTVRVNPMAVPAVWLIPCNIAPTVLALPNGP